MSVRCFFFNPFFFLNSCGDQTWTESVFPVLIREVTIYFLFGFTTKFVQFSFDGKIFISAADCGVFNKMNQNLSEKEKYTICRH